jgi:hypothetical protein
MTAWWILELERLEQYWQHLILGPGMMYGNGYWKKKNMQLLLR